jgi:hypothetical protein
MRIFSNIWNEILLLMIVGFISGIIFTIILT